MIMQEKSAFSAVAAQYDAISRHYDDWFSQPWPAPALRQGEALDALIHTHGLPAKSRVLDLTCGVGTQAYGLARKGHAVTGIDISPGQIDEARKKAAADPAPDRPLDLRFITGNAAQIADVVPTGETFDLIISFGNSFPLLGTNDAIAHCLRQCRELLAPGGMMILSMRDHADLRMRKPYLSGSGTLSNGERKGVWIETAEWLGDGQRYISHVMFIITQPQKEEHHYPFPPLLALTKDEGLSALMAAGFSDVAFAPQADHPAFSFPLFMARKPA